MRTNLLRLLALCAMIILSGCEKDEEQETQVDNSILIGSWSYSVDYGYTGSESTYTFYDDYTVTNKFTAIILGVATDMVTAYWQYEYYGDRLIIKDSNGQSTYKIQISGNTMTLTDSDGDIEVYEKTPSAQDYGADIPADAAIYTLANIPSNASLISSDVWVITDTEASSNSQYSNLTSALKSATGRAITLIFPNLTKLIGSTYGNTAPLYGCTSLNSISLPVAKSIGEDALGSCGGLNSVSLPEVTVVSSEAFFKCSAIRTISLPSATSIKENAFWYCQSLTTASLPSATSIGDFVFADCYSLTELTLATTSTLSSIGSFLFPSSLKIDLYIGDGNGADATTNTWNGKTFKSVTII